MPILSLSLSFSALDFLTFTFSFGSTENLSLPMIMIPLSVSLFHFHFQLWINRELITATDDDAATNKQQQWERSSQSTAGGKSFQEIHFLYFVFFFCILYWPYQSIVLRGRLYAGWSQPTSHCGGRAGRVGDWQQWEKGGNLHILILPFSKF